MEIGHTNILGYSDVDWEGDRRSTSASCVLIGGNLVLWKSKNLNLVHVTVLVPPF